MSQETLKKIAGVLDKRATLDQKEQELWRLVNGLKKRGINLSEKSIFELKKKKGIPLPTGDLADKVNKYAEDEVKPNNSIKQAAREFDPYLPKSLGRRAQAEAARIRLQRQRNIVSNALLGAGIGGTMGFGTGVHFNPDKESALKYIGGGALGGALGGAAVGGLSTALLNKLLYDEYESDLKKMLGNDGEVGDEDYQQDY